MEGSRDHPVDCRPCHYNDTFEGGKSWTPSTLVDSEGRVSLKWNGGLRSGTIVMRRKSRLDGAVRRRRASTTLGNASVALRLRNAIPQPGQAKAQRIVRPW
jgi:hypothetical protein